MMAPGSARVCLGLFTLGIIPTAGCSAIFARDGGSCSTSYAPVVADVLLGLVALGSGGSGVVMGTGLDEWGLTGLGLVGVAGATAHFLAAGNNAVAACRRAGDGEPPSPEVPGRRGNTLEVTALGVYQSVDAVQLEVGGGTLDVVASHRGRVGLGLAVSHVAVEVVPSQWKQIRGDAYTMTSLAPRFEVEPVARTADQIGVGVRLRPAWRWTHRSTDGPSEARGGAPLVAFVLGTTSMWVDFGWGDATATDDMRAMHYQIGWRTSHYEALTGLALIDVEDGIITWASQVAIPFADRWSLDLRGDVGHLMSFTLGLGYRFGP